MNRPDLNALSPFGIADLFRTVSDDYPEDSQSPLWQSRLVAGVFYANDRRREGGIKTDKEWADAVRDVVNTYD